MENYRKETAHHIGVVGLGQIPDTVPKVIAAHISGYLNLTARVLAPLPLAADALDERRLQYDAGRILARMEEMPFPGVDKVVGVLGVDLFVPIFTHVLGEARQGGNAALVSLFRLGPNGTGPGAGPLPAAVLDRSAKIALHELCHLFDLPHCTDTKCLMHFSGDVAELDRTPFSFCRYCAAFFRDAVARCPGE